MGDVTASLDAIERMGTHAQKIEEYKKLAEALFKAGIRETMAPQLTPLEGDDLAVPPPRSQPQLTSGAWQVAWRLSSRSSRASSRIPQPRGRPCPP